MTYKKIISALLCCSTLSFATIYSDGEDGTTNGWRVYDNSPAGATVENVYNEEKQSKVIVLKGDERKNSYVIGDKKNSKGWKNSKELTMKWNMNFSEKFKISVYLQTKKGSRVLYYDGKDKDRGIYKKKYIRLGLGSNTKSGKWIDIVRNLEADLQKYEPSNYIKMVSGMKIQGSGKIDNLELIKGGGQSVGELQISDIEVIKLENNYAKVAWKLNHKATGQVEYGTTKDYGNFSKKESSFKYQAHQQSLRGLEKGTTYHYRIISEDEAGNRAISEDKTFITKGGDFGEEKAFVTKWKITNKHTRVDEEDSSGVWFFYNDKELRIATNSNYTYNFNIDWGDGKTDSSVTQTIVHKYDKEGTYTVSITGLYPKPEKLCIEKDYKYDDPDEPYYDYFYKKGMQDLIAIEQWGTQQWKSMNKAFLYCENLSSMDSKAPDLSKVTDAGSMFKNTYRFNQPVNHWDVSSITDMSYMFSSNHWDHSLYNQDNDQSETYPDFNQDLNNWDTSHVTNMKFMFYGLTKFNSSLSNWNVSHVTDMSSMFSRTKIFNQDISNWDVSSATNMKDMFSESRAFNQNLGQWDVSHVTQFGSMLSYTNLSIENYNQTLKGWSKLDLQHNIEWWGRELEYSGEGEVARQLIIDKFNWDFIYG